MVEAVITIVVSVCVWIQFALYVRLLKRYNQLRTENLELKRIMRSAARIYDICGRGDEAAQIRDFADGKIH